MDISFASARKKNVSQRPRRACVKRFVFVLFFFGVKKDEMCRVGVQMRQRRVRITDCLMPADYCRPATAA